MRKSPREILVNQVQNLERLEAEKQQAADALRQAFNQAKRLGFDPSTLKVVLRLRRLTPEQRKERRALEAIYLAALGMLEGDPLPEEARRRLDEEPAPDAPAPKTGPRSTSSAREAPEPAPAPPPPPKQQPMNLKDPEEARQEGRAGAAAGKRIYDNPYTAWDPCRAAWDEGWCESKKSNGMDTPAAYQRWSKPPEKSDKDKDEKGAA